MPTVLRSGPFRIFFYAGDGNEPPHVHIERDDGEAKFWLDPVRLVHSHGMRSKDISQIHDVVQQHQQDLLEAWDEFFNG
jgi:hypothetical protein